jgi:hypothetical protein
VQTERWIPAEVIVERELALKTPECPEKQQCESSNAFTAMTMIS